MKHDLLDLIDYHEKKAKQCKSGSNNWEGGQKDKYRFHVRSAELIKKLKEELYGK
jgi:hypothetical protein